MGRAKTIGRDMRVGCGDLDQNEWPSKNESGENCWINFQPRKPA